MVELNISREQIRRRCNLATPSSLKLQEVEVTEQLIKFDCFRMVLKRSL
jgi:hypothetical protein